jgi:hypothetical protein
MPLLIERTYWDKKEPAGVYEDSEKLSSGLFCELQRKLTMIACRKGDAFGEERFWRWMAQERERILGVIFQVSELISPDLEPLRMIVITENSWIDEMMGVLERIDIPVFEARVTGMDGLTEDFNGFGASAMRAMLSGELLVGARDRYVLDRIIDSAREAQEISEYDGVLNDVASLIAHDVSRVICKEEKEVEADPKDFERIAIAAMKKRRVNKFVHKKLLPRVRRAAVKS